MRPALAVLLLLVFGPATSAAPGECPELSVGANRQCLSIMRGDGVIIDYAVEVADTDELRKRGLMFRDELPVQEAMLLLYPDRRRIGIWMKNTYLPLDILFVEADGTIVKIAPWAEPHSTETILSPGRARAVLEINGGQAAELGIREGDRVVFPAFEAP